MKKFFRKIFCGCDKKNKLNKNKKPIEALNPYSGKFKIFLLIIRNSRII